MSLLALTTRGFFFACLHFNQKAEGDLLQVDISSLIFKNKRVCETIGPFDGDLSKMHEVEVHVFSDSVLCLGRGTMSEPDAKFTKRLNGYLE